MALQRTAGNRAVARLDGRVLQREGAGGPGTQMALAVPPDLLRQGIGLETRAIADIGLLQGVIEAVHHAEEKGDLADLLGRADALIAGADAHLGAALRIAAAAHGADRGESTTRQLLRALDTVREIVRTMRGEGRDRLRTAQRAGAEAAHRRELDRLKRPSEGRELEARPHRRSERATEADVAEIDNWVAGGWQTLNKELFGDVTEKEREARTFIAKNAPMDKDRWAADVDSRIGGLSASLAKLPSAKGTTYRRATYEDLSVWSSTIGPGALVGSRGFFATSELKGAEGAGGGGAAWGTGAKVYFEITGAAGVPLGPYQKELAGEREVLYPRSAVFEVLAVRIEGPTVFVIMSQIGAIPKGRVVRDPYTGKPVDLT